MTLRIEEWHSAELGPPPGLSELVADAASRDGYRAIDESALAELKAGAKEMPHAAFVARIGDRLVAYAHLSFRTTRHGWRLDLLVHPEHRRVGIGAELTRHVFDHVAWDGGGTLHLWIPATEEQTLVGRRFGFKVVRRLHQQHAPLPAPAMPAAPTVTLRSFTPEDEDGWLAVHNVAFADHPDASDWTPTDFAWRTAEPWFDADGFRLAVDGDGQILGSCWMKLHRHDDPAHDLTDHVSKLVAEIYMLSVAPRGRGTGVAQAVAADGLAWGAAQGATRAMLYVDGENAPALRLYERFGFRSTQVQTCLEAEIAPRDAGTGSNGIDESQ